MDMSLLHAIAGGTRPPPHLTSDLRPTADAAALARDATPAAALAPPLPPSSSQLGVVSQSQLAASAGRRGQLAEGAVLTPAAIDPPERVLKPFGVAMLPERGGVGDAPELRLPRCDAPSEA